MALRVGFIGLGNIGKPMVASVVGAGFDVTVYDLDPAPVEELVAAGARAADTPAALAGKCDVIGICVPEDDHVRAVMGGDAGILAGAAPGTVVAIHSTVLPSTALELEQAAQASGVAVLDACVTGGAARASQGTLTYLVGGAAEAVEKARPYLDANSERVVHAGELGMGCKLKLCINLITYIQWAAAFESMSLAKAVGLPIEVLEEAGRSNGQITDLMTQFMAVHKFPEEARQSEGMQKVLRGHMNVAEKDLAWVLKLAREAEIALPSAALTSQMMARIYGVEDTGRR